MEKKKNQYFNEALSDFTHDVASGRAIRHMVNLGYTVNQIMERLDYPTPRSRVEQTVCRCLLENGTLLEQLPVPEDQLQSISLSPSSSSRFYTVFNDRLNRNGTDHSYVSCPFGTIRRDREIRMQKLLACLTSRERDYILGIPWHPRIVYHSLNDRMREISVQLFLHSDANIRFYFLQTGEMITREPAD